MSNIENRECVFVLNSMDGDGWISLIAVSMLLLQIYDFSDKYNLVFFADVYFVVNSAWMASLYLCYIL